VSSGRLFGQGGVGYAAITSISGMGAQVAQCRCF
jgi:hypothetical protein